MSLFYFHLLANRNFHFYDALRIYAEKHFSTNILFKLESHILDVSYVKVATKAVFDINESAEECEVPDYPVHEFALFQDDIKTKNVYKVENFCKVLKDASLDVSEDNVSYATSNIDDDEDNESLESMVADSGSDETDEDGEDESASAGGLAALALLERIVEDLDTKG